MKILIHQKFVIQSSLFRKYVFYLIQLFSFFYFFIFFSFYFFSFSTLMNGAKKFSSKPRRDWKNLSFEILNALNCRKDMENRVYIWWLRTFQQTVLCINLISIHSFYLVLIKDQTISFLYALTAGFRICWLYPLRGGVRRANHHHTLRRVSWYDTKLQLMVKHRTSGEYGVSIHCYYSKVLYTCLNRSV